MHPVGGAILRRPQEIVRMPRVVPPLAAAALTVILVAACGSSTPSPSPTPAPDRLDGTSWALESIDDQPLPDGVADNVPTLAFAGGSVSGGAGCNTFTGSYTLDGNSLSFGPLAVTAMACEPDVSAVETAYLAALGGVSSWAVPADAAMGTELTLTGSGPKLVFQAP